MRSYEFLKMIKDVGEATQTVGGFYYGDIYQAINGNEVKYPVMSAALQSMTVRENYKSFTIQVYAAERLMNGEENKIFVIAELFDLLETYVYNLKRMDEIEFVEYDRQWNVANFQTSDICVCCYGTIEVIVRSDYDVCAD